MLLDDIVPWRWLERWGGTLVVVAGVMVIGAGVHKVLGATMGIELPLVFQNILGGQGGLLVALIGLSGLYPRLAERMPRLSRVVAASIVIAVVGQVVTLGVLIAVFVWETVAGVTIDPPAFVFAFLFAGYLGTMFAFIVFGLNGIRSRTPSRAVGILLVLAPVVAVGLLVVPVDMPSVGGLSPADLWLPVVLLAIGYLLHTESTSSHPAEPVSDESAG